MDRFMELIARREDDSENLVITGNLNEAECVVGEIGALKSC